MTHIFNSLGSNYSLSFALHAAKLACMASTDHAVEKLKHFFEQQFHGKAFGFYKGRDAIAFILQSCSFPKNSIVLTQGLSCFAVEEGIVRAGLKPCYVDLDEKGSIQPSISTLSHALRAYPNTKAVLIQHTLGYPANTLEIRKFCTKHNLYFIEDLAQAYGSVDKNNTMLGTHADAVVLSFGRDKIIDAISGGMAVIKKNLPKQYTQKVVSKLLMKKELLYPLYTLFIRKTYGIGIGKFLHSLCIKLQVFSSPMDHKAKAFSSLPTECAKLALFQLSTIKNQLKHRKTLARIYHSYLQQYTSITEKEIEQGANLRYFIFAQDTSLVIQHLKKKNIYISDRWYSSVVDSGSLQKASVYEKGSCPRAEKSAQHILNLPTHQEVSIKLAHSIAKEVQRCLK